MKDRINAILNNIPSTRYEVEVKTTSTLTEVVLINAYSEEQMATKINSEVEEVTFSEVEVKKIEYKILGEVTEDFPDF